MSPPPESETTEFGGSPAERGGVSPSESTSSTTPQSHVAPPAPQLPQHSQPADGAGAEATGDGKVKRKKLKGKRAVVRWLKFFRYKKKKNYERMTAEEKILHKLRKAQRKEERLVEALKKIEPSEPSKANHDPEILTPEEDFYFLKMGLKCKKLLTHWTTSLTQFLWATHLSLTSLC